MKIKFNFCSVEKLKISVAPYRGFDLRRDFYPRLTPGAIELSPSSRASDGIVKKTGFLPSQE
jgi:hypothetical protein